LSSLGFEVADFAGTNPDAVIRLTPVSADAGIGTTIPRTEDGFGRVVSLEAYPNPGRDLTIRVISAGGAALPPRAASLAVYDIAGRLVRPLWRGWLEGGPLELNWDGTNSSAARCAPGLYVLEMVAGSERWTRPVLLLE
jgi:hypothetical protein